MIVLDTVRFDTFNKLLKERNLKLSSLEGFVQLENCIAPSSWTLPSHASLFTGMYPSEHGAHETRSVKSLDIDKIKLKSSTIVSELKDLGYKTYGVSANPYVHPIYGFDEFDHFNEESYFTDIFGSIFEISREIKPEVAKYRNVLVDDTDSNITAMLKLAKGIGRENPALLLDMIASGVMLTPVAAIKKLKAKYIEGWPIEKGGKNAIQTIDSMRLKKPFFLFVNLMEAHDPYIGKKGMDFNWSTPFLKEKVSEVMVKRWRDAYHIGLRKASDYAYAIVKYILERFENNTIIIITSDHGQEFGEHGFIGHGTVLDDEVLRVPFMIRLPEEISHKKGRGYISLVSVRDFLLAAINEENDPMERLYSKKVYAESYGVPSNIHNLEKINVRKLNSYEKYKRRTFR